MPRWNGGVIGAANNPTQSSAKGIWSLSEATKAIRAGLWPPSNAGADPYFENVTLLLPGDGTNGAQNNTFLDSSTNNFTITRNGNTTQGTFSPFSKADGRWSNYFNGSSDFLNIGSGYPSSLDLGSSNFTIEGWVYLQASTKQLLLGNLNNSSGTCTFFVILNNTSASARYEIRFGSSSFNLGTGTVPTNQWVHVCVMRSGTSIFLFENGAQVGTTQTLSGSITSSTNQMRVGGAIAGEYPLSGYASNLRMVIGSAVYSTSGFTVPTTFLTAITNTALLTCQSNRFVDSSTNAIAVTTSGTPSIQTFSPFPSLTAYAAGTNGGSGYFDGSGDYLTAPADNAFGFGTGDFKIEMWIYPTAIASGDVGLWYVDQTGGLVTSLSPTNGYLGIGTRLTSYDLTSTHKPALNAWTHVVFSRVSGTGYIFANGTQVATGSLSSKSYLTSVSGLAVTAGNFGNNPAGSGYFQGYISGLVVVKGSGVTSVTVPTAPPSPTGTNLCMNYTNGGIIDTSMSNDLETVGNAQISTTQSKFGGGSMSFDGTGDYLIMRNTENLTLGTGDFTIEFWVYYNSGLTADVALFDGRPASTNGVYPLIYSNTTGKVVWYINSAARITATTTLSTGTWYHIAVARSGTSTKMFINGTQEGSTYTDSNSYLPGANRPTIGAAGATLGADPLNGYIDDLRVTKGYARYTSNFTAPTAPFNAFGD